MIQVQVRITVAADRVDIPIDVLEREDASAEERTIAHAVEQWLLGLNQAVAADAGVPMQTTFIGPQHEGGRLQATALAHAEADVLRLREIIRLARERLWDADGRGVETVRQVVRAVGRILRRADEPAAPEEGQNGPRNR